MSEIGDSHGDVAIAPNGNIYVSVQGGERSGLQVYDKRGQYLRNLPDAPTDFHGFIITKAGGKDAYILGARLQGQEIVKLDLAGKVLMRIPSTSIPDRYKGNNVNGDLSVRLTGVAAAPNGDIYAVDGYGRDFIHHFARDGQYLGTFGGVEAPWNFKLCHKIGIDPRFRPVRLVCVDRRHGRLVAMNLDGQVIGTVAEGLDEPAAIAFFKNDLAVAELGGRVTILDRGGQVIARVGANETAEQTKNNNVPPSAWQDHLFYAPHGIAYDDKGNLLVAEFSKWGRVSRVNIKR